MRRYFTNDVQFNTVVNFCGSVGVVDHRDEPLAVARDGKPAGNTGCKLGILNSGRGALHSKPAALV